MKKLDQNEMGPKAIDTNTGIASVFLLVALAFLLSRGISRIINDDKLIAL